MRSSIERAAATMMEGLEALLGEFILDARERMDRVEQNLLDLPTLSDVERADALSGTKRELHTLKGNAGMMGLADLQALAHRMEDDIAAGGELDIGNLLAAVDAFRSQLRGLDEQASVETPGGDTTADAAGPDDTGEQSFASVRVPFAVLDPLIDLIGEMVIVRNRMSDSVERGCSLDPTATDFAARSAEAWSAVQLAQDSLNDTLDVIRERVMALRMTPLSVLLGTLRRIVHDEAAGAQKRAAFETDGGDTPLDKALLEVANEALGHLVRNAVIHGLEDPSKRVALGKPETGTVRVRASTKGDEVWIEVSDDGGGIDRDELYRVARSRGVVTDQLQDVTEVLFESGFTTRERADMGSGRGVGLSAVRKAVQRQGGEIEITTALGRGTTFLLRLPISVSIARALLVTADDEVYAVPLTAVVESRRMRLGDSHTVNQAGVFRWRDELLTLLDLGWHFQTNCEARPEGYVIVIEVGGKRRGLVADHILGVREVVVKGLDPIVGHPPGVGGSTVLGDGRPILILDPKRLVEVKPFSREAA
ncbi:MAG: chemotaxis protein CheW [Gemmatimonadota bacterium]|nr:MAG: chemotaxis protein CheW [Gemmatimonadota bacterium]